MTPVSPIDPDGISPVELQERVHADRRGEPYLVFRDSEGGQRIVALADLRELTVGRAPGCELCLEWDVGVSGVHAQLERLGRNQWAVADDGLSRNGSIVNGERLIGRRRLVDGDVLRFGSTCVIYRAPGQELTRTVQIRSGGSDVHLSPAQRRVLVALCRPYRGGQQFARPASNREIADELFISIDAVKTHMRALFDRFGVEPLARDLKRAELARLALVNGVISPRDLD